MRPQREDTLPWYRQFWPWFVIALPASAVIAGLTTVWIAMQSDDSLVFRSDEGMNVVTERNLAAARAASDSGIAATIEINSGTGAVTTALSAIESMPMATELRLELMHPTRESLDLETVLLRAMDNDRGEAQWTGHFVRPPEGRYYVVLSSGDAWRLSGEWSGEASLSLGASAEVSD